MINGHTHALIPTFLDENCWFISINSVFFSDQSNSNRYAWLATITFLNTNTELNLSVDSERAA